MNSVLQCLNHSPGLAEAMDSCQDSELMKEAKILFKKLRAGDLVQPQFFKEEFARRHPSFLGNFQQDAGELICF